MTITHNENHAVHNHHDIYKNGNITVKGCCLQSVKYISLPEKLQKMYFE
jgi:hypothetical protein